MKSKKKKKKYYYTGGSASPAEALGKIRDDKMGMSVGSMLKGGTIKYKNNGPGDPPKKGPNETVTVPTAAPSAATTTSPTEKNFSCICTIYC